MRYIRKIPKGRGLNEPILHAARRRVGDLQQRPGEGDVTDLQELLDVTAELAPLVETIVRYRVKPPGEVLDGNHVEAGARRHRAVGAGNGQGRQSRDQGFISDRRHAAKNAGAG